MKDGKLYKATLQKAHMDCANAQRNLLKCLTRASVKSTVNSRLYDDAIGQAQCLVATLKSVRTLHEPSEMVE